MSKGWTGVALRDPAEYGWEARRPWHFQCPEPNCYMSVSAKDEADALKQQQDHTCPHWGGQTKVGWSVTKTLVQQMWDLIDTDMSRLKEENVAPEEKDALKIRARAIAECLAIFMVPFFSTPDEIAHEALKRYKAKAAGEEYDSPGMNARRYERPGLESKDSRFYIAPDGFTSDPAQSGLPANKKRGGTVRTVTAPVAHHFSTAEIDAINYMSGTGGFSPEQLANTYGVSVAIIRSVLI